MPVYEQKMTPENSYSEEQTVKYGSDSLMRSIGRGKD